MMNIGIAGAGVLGRLLAWRLTRAGHRVTVLDPAGGPLDRGAAGWTAAGMLSPSAELECADLQVFQDGLDSIDMWAEIVAALPGPPDFARRGVDGQTAAILLIAQAPIAIVLAGWSALFLPLTLLLLISATAVMSLLALDA
ncbi:MAG: FAD-dependent oxidoreductase, partial [Burkholderiales bacterium]|nr:FAD-dependent oxidoreductase [Burkholderiales bacterium]